MSDPIITVSNLGKKYRLQHLTERQNYTALRDVLTSKFKGLFQKRTGKMNQNSVEDFWALKDVGFEVKRGEVVGIIGRNGAGKSTLLKILSRITEPSEGRVVLRGRVASLLEVGTGFHPELTGRENVYLNGAILGMSRVEIKRKFDEIVGFAEVEKFLDTPVKRYSSGMYVRLAFAVAAHLEPEILIVDEVLAVGDAEFQKKCLGKMQNVSRGGRTVLFVSHNMSAVQALCGSALYLQNGSIVGCGEAQTIVNQYLAAGSHSHNQALHSPIKIDDDLSLTRFEFTPNPAVTGAPVRFFITFDSLKPLRISELAVLIYSAHGSRVAILDLRPCGLPANLEAAQQWQCRGEIPSLGLIEGEYQIGLFVMGASFMGDLLDLVNVTVSAKETNGYVPYPVMYRGLLELEFSAQLQTRISV